MLQFVRYLPAWLLKLLPARLARRCVIDCSSTTTFPPESVRQLLVDVSVIHQSDARTGIQRVVRSLLLQLLAAQPIGFQVRPVFATRQNGYCYADPNFLDASAPPSKDAAKAVQVFRNDLFLGLDLAAHLLPHHQAQVLSWKRSGVKVHVVVYDLLPLHHPQWFNPKTTRNFKRWIRWLAVYADSMVCISETVKTEVTVWLSVEFGLPTGAIPASTIMLGANISASAPSVGQPLGADLMLARMRCTPAALMVGTVEPRKGYDQVLSAFEEIWQRTKNQVPLYVVVGRPGWKTESIQAKLRNHPRFGKNLFWIEDASDELLQRLYEASHCVLVPSHAEGFGLPVVEAALYGKPVLARNIGVFRELNLPNVTYFSDDTPLGLAAAIEQLLQQSNVEGPDPTNISFHSWQDARAQLYIALGLRYLDTTPVSNRGKPRKISTTHYSVK
jgi:glycosyltransferase involved in cell wall biosynthesis